MIALTPGPAAYALAREFEGFRSRCYLCPSNVATIGFGHTGSDVKMGMPPIDLIEAERLLKVDMEWFARLLNGTIATNPNQNQFDALLSLLFNVGPGRPTKRGSPGQDGIITLASGRPSTILRLVNEGKFAEAAEQFERWNKGRDKTGALIALPGLVRRRLAEKKLFLSPVVVQ